MADLQTLVQQINDIQLNAETVASGEGMGALMKKAQLCSSLAAAVGKATDHVQLGASAVVAAAPVATFPKTTLAGYELKHGFWQTVVPVGSFLLAVAIANYATTRKSGSAEEDRENQIRNRLVYAGTYAFSVVIAMKGAATVKETIVRDTQSVARALVGTAKNLMH